MGTGVVLLLDGLGTKGVWQRHSPLRAVAQWEAMHSYARSVVKSLFDAAEWRYRLKWSFFVFSDTIIACAQPRQGADFVVDPVYAALLDAAGTASTLIASGLRIGLKLRGALALGDFVKGKSIVVGPAIDDAATWYEEAQWVGCMLTPNTNDFLDRYYRGLRAWSVEHHHKRFVAWTKWKVPLKDENHLDTYAVNWPWFLHRSDSGDFDLSREARGNFISLLDTLDTMRALPVHRTNTIAFHDGFRKTYRRATPARRAQLWRFGP